MQEENFFEYSHGRHCYDVAQMSANTGTRCITSLTYCKCEIAQYGKNKFLDLFVLH